MKTFLLYTFLMIPCESASFNKAFKNYANNIKKPLLYMVFKFNWAYDVQANTDICK